MSPTSLTGSARTRTRPSGGLVTRGADYTHARTTFPSDSFPGMVAQLSGGGPGTTGVYYDDTYNHALLPPGTLDCSAAARGTEVPWTKAADRSAHQRQEGPQPG